MRSGRLAAVATTVATALVLASGVGPAAAATPSGGGSPYVAVKHKQLLHGTVKAHQAVSFALAGVPSTGVSAVVLSVSVTAPAASGSLVTFPYGARRPGTVSLAFSRTHGASGLVVVAPGSHRRTSLFNSSSALEHVAATVVGYYAAAGTPKETTAFVPVTPKRLASVALKVKGSVAFAGGRSIPGVDVAGLVLAVTVSAPATSGALVVFPYASKPPRSKSLAYAAGRSTTTLLIAKPGSRGRLQVTGRNTGPVRVWVDVVGYLKTLHPPGAPRSVTAVAGSSVATVRWTAPASDGGAPISAYTVVASPGGTQKSVSGASRSLVFTGLTPETSYTFTVVATNSRGTSPASAATDPVTPFTLPPSPTGAQLAVAANGLVYALWAEPFDTGGVPVTSYVITVRPSGATTTAQTDPDSISSGGFAVISGTTVGVPNTVTVVALNAAGASAPSAASPPTYPPGVSVASVADSGAQSDDNSANSSVSADGRYVAFESIADNLVAGDTNMAQDVFVRDRQTGRTTLVSMAASGKVSANSDSEAPSISADGRYVAFDSLATNLVSPATTGSQVFVRDLQTGTTTLVSRNNLGVQGNAGSGLPAISADGSTVAFASSATNLSGLNTTPGRSEIYVVGVANHHLTPVTVGVGAVEPSGSSVQPSISGDGRLVAYSSSAANLVSAPASGGYSQVYVTDASTGSTTMESRLMTVSGNGDSTSAKISANGQYVAFQSLSTDLAGIDTNASADVFVERLGADGPQTVSNGMLGAQADHGGEDPSISADGTVITYDSYSDNIVPTGIAFQDQVYRTAWSYGTTVLASHAADGSEGNDYSQYAALSGDGQHVSFWSAATNLTPGDTNGKVDVDIADLPPAGS